MTKKCASQCKHDGRERDAVAHDVTHAPEGLEGRVPYLELVEQDGAREAGGVRPVAVRKAVGVEDHQAVE